MFPRHTLQLLSICWKLINEWIIKLKSNTLFLGGEVIVFSWCGRRGVPGNNKKKTNWKCFETNKQTQTLIFFVIFVTLLFLQLLSNYFLGRFQFFCFRHSLLKKYNESRMPKTEKWTTRANNFWGAAKNTSKKICEINLLKLHNLIN